MAPREYYDYDVIEQAAVQDVLFELTFANPCSWLTPEQIAEKTRRDIHEVRAILLDLERDGSACRIDERRWAHHTETPEAYERLFEALVARGRAS